MPDIRSLASLCAIAALAALLLAACGDSDDLRVDIAVATVAPNQPASAVLAPTPEPTPQPPSPWDMPPQAAEDPTALAAQLVAAERAIRDPAVGGRELAWMAQLQQLIYRRIAPQPQWREIALAALPPDLRPSAVANLTARTDLRAMVTPQDSLPPWRIVEPAPMGELLGYYREAEAEFGVPWHYLASIHLVETLMGRIRGTSVAGAQGPMQFMPATWAAYGQGDVNDNRDAIRAAARYLRASGAPRDMATAVYRYNPDQRYVRAVTAYAEVMAADANAYRGYYHWQVYHITTGGDVLLPVGYGRE
jgi:membrane-bound lytic murein transglycosylase B